MKQDYQLGSRTEYRIDLASFWNILTRITHLNTSSLWEGRVVHLGGGVHGHVGYGRGLDVLDEGSPHEHSLQTAEDREEVRAAGWSRVVLQEPALLRERYFVRLKIKRPQVSYMVHVDKAVINVGSFWEVTTVFAIYKSFK